jgi:chemotaxis protein CheD
MAQAETIPPQRSQGRLLRQRTRPACGPVKLPRSDLPRRYLKAGDLMICRTACEVTTVLGSCVAVTFFSSQLGLGGICHAMLPAPRHGDDDGTVRGEARWKYVSFALQELIECFTQPGLPPAAVEIKIFGGGHLIARTASGEGGANVGANNVACARRMLSEAGFKIAAGDIGGPHGRKIVFNTLTGAVHMKLLSPSSVKD